MMVVPYLTLSPWQDLLTPISDARFHFGRKLTNTDISVLHQACANRPNPHPAVLDIVKASIYIFANITIKSNIHLFSAVHCHGGVSQ